MIASLFFLSQINEVKLSNGFFNFYYLLLIYKKACENYTREIKDYLQNINTFQVSEDEKRLLQNENFDLIDMDLNKPLLEVKIDQKNVGGVHWTSWFKQVIFYQYGIVYMCVRLACNVTSVEKKLYFIY